jgi:hypothetical protein
MRTTVSLETDENGDLILPLPPEVLEAIGAEVGDTLQWHENSDGTFTITKVNYDSDSGIEGRL